MLLVLRRSRYSDSAVGYNALCDIFSLRAAASARRKRWSGSEIDVFNALSITQVIQQP